MNQQDVEQWITQQGGDKRVQYSRSTREVDNPAADPMTAKAAGVPFSPTAPAKITVSEEKWTAVDGEGKPTGAVLHVRRKPDGDFDIVDQSNVNPTKPGVGEAAPPGGKPFIDDGPEVGATGRRWGWNAATKAYDRDLGSSPAAQKADQPQTGDVREPVPNRPGWTSITRVTKQGGNETKATTFIGPDGKEVSSLPVESGSDSKPLEGYPGWSVRTTKNGTETKTVFLNPKGEEATDPRPSANTPKDTTTTENRNGQTYIKHTVTKPDGSPGEVYYTDQKGNRVELPGEQKPGQVITINGESYWATPAADPGQPPQLTRMNPGGPPLAATGPQFAPGMTPSEYLNQRRAWLIEQKRAGANQKDIDADWDAAVQTATAKQNEANTAATQQNQRLSSATTGVGQAMQSVEALNKYLPEGSDLGGRALEAFLGIQRGQAQRMGGYGPPPGQLAVPAAPTGPAPSSLVAAIPPPPAPSAPPAAPAGARPAPIFAPQSPVNLPPGAPSAALGAPSARPMPTGAAAATSAAPTTYLPSSAQAAANAGPVPGQSGSVWQPPVPSAPDADPLLNVRHRQTGEIKQVRLSQINNAADKDLFEVLDPNSSGAVQPAGAPMIPTASPIPSDMPQATPTSSQPTSAPSQYGGGQDTPTVSAIPESPYDFQARIASTPPWMMSEDDFKQAEAMGIGDQFWKTPGRAA